MEAPVEDYERVMAARSQGLLRSRSAWNDAKETWLVPNRHAFGGNAAHQATPRATKARSD